MTPTDHRHDDDVSSQRKSRPAPVPALVVLGAGGFGRGVLDVIEAVNQSVARYRFLGFLDREGVTLPPSSRGRCPIIGSDRDLNALDALYAIGIGSGAVRKSLDLFASGIGKFAATLVHPASTTGGDVELGPGVVLTADD